SITPFVQAKRSTSCPPRESPMQRHVLALALMSAITLAACQSTQESRITSEAAEAPGLVLPPPSPPAPPSAMPDIASASLDSVSVTGTRLIRRSAEMAKMTAAYAPAPMLIEPTMAPPPANTEQYAEHDDNPVHRVSEQPVSTFSIDVDTGSYSNVRRMIRQGVRPPADA